MIISKNDKASFTLLKLMKVNMSNIVRNLVMHLSTCFAKLKIIFFLIFLEERHIILGGGFYKLHFIKIPGSGASWRKSCFPY
jgi:hypothetical protein